MNKILLNSAGGFNFNPTRIDAGEIYSHNFILIFNQIMKKWLKPNFHKDYGNMRTIDEHKLSNRDFLVSWLITSKTSEKFAVTFLVQVCSDGTTVLNPIHVIELQSFLGELHKSEEDCGVCFQDTDKAFLLSIQICGDGRVTIFLNAYIRTIPDLTVGFLCIGYYVLKPCSNPPNFFEICGKAETSLLN